MSICATRSLRWRNDAAHKTVLICSLIWCRLERRHYCEPLDFDRHALLTDLPQPYVPRRSRAETTLIWTNVPAPVERHRVR
jgi:hypothetical protein